MSDDWIMRLGAKRFVRLVAAQLLIATVTLTGVVLRVHAGTIGFVFLIAILLIAVWTDLAIALLTSVVATLCYNFFFMPPLRTFTIQEPSNWVALIAFFIASVIASRLMLRARMKAEDAEARQREVEALYALSIDLFTATNRIGALGEAAARALANVGAAGGGLVLYGKGQFDQHFVSWSGPKMDGLDDIIAGVARHKRTLEFPSLRARQPNRPADRLESLSHTRDVYLPLRLGESVIGVLVAQSTQATLRALESAAMLVALAVERERFLAESAHIQALQEGDALKTSLLRAVSHDLASPLTAISLQIERLRSIVDEPRAVSVVAAIAEDAGRLQRRIENLLAMARLEARSVVPRPEPTPAADLFRAVREHLPLIVQGRPVHVRVTDDCPDVFVDPSLALEILVNLMENAHQASPAGERIELTAVRHPLDPQRVRLEVADRGPGIRHGTFGDELAAPSDTSRHGLGLEIARSLAAASGGQVTLADRPGGGAVARVDLPAAELPIPDEEVHA